MFILRLRLKKDPSKILGVLRADTAIALAIALEHSFLEKPRVDLVDSDKLDISYFKEGPLQDFLPPHPTDKDTGIVNLGEFTTLVQLRTVSAINQIRERAVEEWAEVICNTVSSTQVLFPEGEQTKDKEDVKKHLEESLTAQNFIYGAPKV